MSPASLPLPLNPAYIGATWTWIVQLFDGDADTPMDFTGRTLTADLDRKGDSTVHIEVEAVEGADPGVVSFSATATETAEWARGSYVVEVRLTEGAEVRTILVGELPVLKGAAEGGQDSAGARQDSTALGLLVTATEVTQVVLALAGLNGKSAYQVAVADGYGGTEEEYAQGPIDAAAAAAAATAQTALALTATTNATSAATSANTAASAANTAADAADDAAAYALASGRVVATVADLADIVSPSIGDGARVVADALGDVTDGNGEWTYGAGGWDWIAPLANPTAQGHFDMVEAGYYEALTIGVQTEPVTGTNAGSGTYVFGEPVPAAGRIYGYWLWAAATTTITVKRFTKSGDVFTMVAGSQRDIVISSAGLIQGEFASGYYADAGDYIGFYTPSGKLVYGADHGTSCFYGAGNVTTNFTDTADNTNGMMIGFHLYQPTINVARVEAIETELTKPLVVVRASPELYVRGPFSETQDIVERFRAGITPSVSESGVCDAGYSRLIPVATTSAGTVTAYNASTDYLGNSGDDASPVWINGLALGGNHGLSSLSLTATGHGKANVDVGSRWTDGAAKVWVLARIADANTLIVVPVLSGTATAWVRGDMTLTGSTLTHSADATNTGAITVSASVSGQIYPWVQSHAYQIWLDGKTEITTDGSYTADYVQVSEQYGIPNAKSVVEDLIARVGSSEEPQFNRSTIQTQAEVDIVHGFFPGELMKVDYQVRAVQPWDDVSIQGVQASARYRTGTDKLTLLVPETGTEATTGLDFSTPQNITSNSALIEFQTAEWLDPNKPPARLVQIVTTSGDTPKTGFMLGYSPRYGGGVPATRAPLLDYAIQVSASEKLYIRALEGGSVVADQVVSLSAYRGSYDAAGCGCTVNAVYSDGDKKVWVLDVHETLTGEWIALPVWLRTRLIGKRLTVFDKSSSATLHSAFVGARGAQISVTGAKGWLIIEIG